MKALDGMKKNNTFTPADLHRHIKMAKENRENPKVIARISI